MNSYFAVPFMAVNNNKVTPSFIAPILDLLPDAIIWVYPIFDSNNNVEDFEVRYSNRSADKAVGHPEGSLTGLRLRADGVPSRQSAEGNFQHYLDVYQTGETKEYTFFAHHSGQEMETIRQVYEGGVLSATRDRRAQREAERKEQKTSRTLATLVDISLNGILVYDAVRDEAGKIVDFKNRHYNTRSNQFLGVTPEERQALTMREILKMIEAEHIFNEYVKVVEHGVTLELEQYIQRTGTWLSNSTVKLDDGLLIMLTDITELKQWQHGLEEQKKVLDNILKYSSNGISVSEMIRDEQGKVVDALTILANEAAVKYTGLPRELYLSKKATELDPNIINTPYYQMCINTLETGEPIVTQYLLETTGRWLELTVSKMDDEHLIHIFTDVTDIKQAHLEGERSANALKAVFNAAQAGMFTFAPEYDEHNELVDFRFVMVNPTLAAYVGQTPEPLIGELGSKWFPGYLTNGVFDMYKHTFITGETQRREFHYNVDGINVYLDLQSVRTGGEVLVTFTDHTELRRAHAQLERTVEALQRSNASLEEFAHAASHDLKEPIRKIETFAGRLKQKLSDRLNEDEADIFARMESATERMRLLVEDLLSYSQVNITPQEKKDIDLNEKVRLVLTDLEVDIEEKQAKINVGQLPVIKGYGRQMQQLFQNLVSNALKYSKPGVPPEISITAEPVSTQNGNFHLLQVRDNGIGFEQQYAERIFQMFHRLHGKAQYSGTGVGLSIVRKVAENHGGYVKAESIPGEGATFTVYLPA